MSYTSSIEKLNFFTKSVTPLSIDILIMDEGEDSYMITLCVDSSGDYIKKEDFIPFFVLSAFFKFMRDKISDIIETLKSKINDKEESSLSLFPMYAFKDNFKEEASNLFLEYLYINEVELLCDIEREKSPFYPNKYEKDFYRLKKITNDSGDKITYKMFCV